MLRKLRKFPFIPRLLSVFIMKDVSLCPMHFLLRGLWGFLLMWYITQIDFFLNKLNHSCIAGINSTCSWYIILFLYCWIWFASILLRIFIAIFVRDLILGFLAISLSGGVILASWSWGVFPVTYFWLTEYSRCDTMWYWRQGHRSRVTPAWVSWTLTVGMLPLGIQLPCYRKPKALGCG